tara:strand:+ start:359 stop:982 length:624 start_codon:yes stop_codon:yes gene_type:complete
MALTTYSELQATIGDFLNRSDLTSVIPTFVSLAESYINRDIRHWQMENRATTTIDSRYATRPSDWVETIRFQITSGNTSALSLLSQKAMSDKRQSSENVAGTPKFYCHSEGQFEVFPTPDDSYPAELLYYQQIPALSDTNTSNWLLTQSPDVYLYGALLHSAPYLADDARSQSWAALYGAAVSALNLNSQNASNSGSGLTMKIRGLG